MILPQRIRAHVNGFFCLGQPKQIETNRARLRSSDYRCFHFHAATLRRHFEARKRTTGLTFRFFSSCGFDAKDSAASVWEMLFG